MFFEKFELLADAPDAVARMRELVLQLAVQGRLVAQSSDAEPADALAVKISNDRAAFVKARSLARQRVFAPVAADQCPFDLPSGWLWTRLGNLCRVQAGFAFVSAAFIQGESGVPMIRIRDITKHHTQVNYVGEYREEFLVDAGDYLVGMDGNFTVAKWRGPRALLNQRVSRLQWYSQHLEPSFFAIALQYRLSELQGTKAYTTVDHLSSGQIENAVVPLPPLAEQKRIVAKVDELMALCDRLEAQQQERDTRHAALARASLSRFAEAPTPANLDFLFHKSYTITPADLRKSILTLAVQGKLVSQDAHDEPAANAVRHVPQGARPARFDKRSTARIQGIAALSVGPTEREVPRGWVCVPLIQIAQLESGHTPSRSRPDWWGGDVSWVGVVDARLHDGMTIFETRQHTNQEGLANSAARLLPVGTVCVSRTASVGYVIILGKPMATSQDFVNWVPSNAVTSDWLRLVFTSEKDAFERFSKGAVHQTIYYPEWLAMHTLLPPIAEQRRIVAKVDQLMALVDRLETELSEAKAKSTALLDAVIHELLNPTAEIIDLASYRAAVGCYAISKMQGKRYFGRTAAMKVLYLAQAHVGLELGLKPMREAAGPLDSWLYRFEEQGEREAWFKVVDDKKKIEYRAGRALAEQSAQAERTFTADQRKEFDRLLALFSDRATEEAEIIATLFAAWNDFLIDGHEPSDDEIVREVRENWHEKKGRFTPALLRKWLGWLRQNDLVPQGRSPRTAHQTKLLLN